MTVPTLHEEGEGITRADDIVYPAIGGQNPDRILPSHPKMYANDLGHGLLGEYPGFQTRRDEVVTNGGGRNAPAQRRHAKVPCTVVVFATRLRPSLRHCVQRRLRTIDVDGDTVPNTHPYRLGPADIAAIHFRFYDHLGVPPRTTRITRNANICSRDIPSSSPAGFVWRCRSAWKSNSVQRGYGAGTNLPSYRTRKLRRSASSRKHKKISSRSLLLSSRPSRQSVTTTASQ